MPQIEREPLPADFEPQLRAVDDLLSERAAAEREPAGLSQRVFKASVRLLPQPMRVSRPDSAPSRRLRVAIHEQWWGRLAVAASLGIVVVLGSVLLPESSGPISLDGARTAAADADFDLGPFDSDPVAYVTDQVQYLLTTDEMDSFDVLAGELEALVSDIDL